MIPLNRMTSSELSNAVDLFEVKPGVRFSVATLKDQLTDVESVLFFGKLYDLDYVQLSSLMSKVLKSQLADELFNGEHSTELQDYLVDIVPAYVNVGDVQFGAVAPKGELLPEVWAALEVEVAQSIKDVAARLSTVTSRLPGKQGSMVFRSMMTLNKQRPTLGDYKAKIHHDPVKPNLLILDVSGSMSERTVRALVEDVVALSFKANASLAIVSDSTTVWDPGTYTVDSVLQAAEYMGTHYETLAPLMQRDWGVVITVADYDSSPSAFDALAHTCNGSIDKVLDISLVNRPTYLAECVGQFAAEVQPLLVAPSPYVLSY